MNRDMTLIGHTLSAYITIFKKNTISKQLYLFSCFLILLLIVYILKKKHFIAIKGSIVHNTQNSPLFQTFNGNEFNYEIKYRNGWMSDEDPDFLKYIHNNWVVTPGNKKRNISYSQSEKHFSQIGQSKLVDKLLNQRLNGFFIECGAGDGLVFSNSLFFELYRNWTGLLIEPNPYYFSKILRISRQSYITNTCLSTTRSSQITKFRLMKMLSGIEGLVPSDTIRFAKDISHVYTNDVIYVQCFTLYSLLLAINQTEIDYFSLDVEGVELEILQTIPFDKIKINILTIEYAYMRNPSKSKKKLMKVRSFFKTLGNYKEVQVIRRQDVIFQRI